MPDPKVINELLRKHAADISMSFVLELLPLLGMRLTVKPISKNGDED